MIEATTTANVGYSATGEGAPAGGWPFFGRFGLALQSQRAKRLARCLRKAKSSQARLKCDEQPAGVGGVAMLRRSGVRPLTMSIFRDAIARSHLVEQDLSQHYLAIELNDHSKRLLAQRFNPQKKGWQVDPHHVTLKHDLSDDDLAWVQKHLGKSVNMRVTHHAAGPAIHAVRVAPIGKRGKRVIERAKKAHPHVTIGYDPTLAKPQHSNDLLAKTTGQRLDRFVHVGGTIKLLPK